MAEVARRSAPSFLALSFNYCCGTLKQGTSVTSWNLPFVGCRHEGHPDAIICTTALKKNIFVGCFECAIGTQTSGLWELKNLKQWETIKNKRYLQIWYPPYLNNSLHVKIISVYSTAHEKRLWIKELTRLIRRHNTDNQEIQINSPNESPLPPSSFTVWRWNTTDVFCENLTKVSHYKILIKNTKTELLFLSNWRSTSIWF